MYVFYGFRECHYFKRTKIEIKLKIRIAGANHDDQHG